MENPLNVTFRPGDVITWYLPEAAGPTKVVIRVEAPRLTIDLGRSNALHAQLVRVPIKDPSAKRRDLKVAYAGRY